MTRIIIVILIFPINFCFSQISNVLGAGNEVLRIQKPYADIEGTPYLFPEWVAGEIIDGKGSVYSNVQIRYDIYRDEVEVKQEGNTLIINKSLYPSFTIILKDQHSDGNVRRMFRSGYSHVPGYATKDYFEILVDGHTTVLKRHETSLREESIANYGATKIVKSFRANNRYFIVNESTATEVKLNNKSIMEALGDKEEELQQFLTKNKMKVRSEDDLINLVKHYDSLF